MSGADHVVFNPLEKPSAADWNNAQSMQARTLMTLMRHMYMQRISGIGLGNDTETVVPLCNGMQVVPNGSNVTVQAGFLLQDSASLSPVPGTYDSNYRVALNLTDLAVTAPSPIGDTFYLLEAQMSESVATESRKVLNQTTRNFVATTVSKTATRGITTQWTTVGSPTNYPAPSGGNWVVLAGVFRPAGGGAVLNSHIQDMRLQPDLVNAGEVHFERSNRPAVHRLSVTSDNDTAVRLSAEANVFAITTYSRGLKLHVRDLLGSSPAGWTPEDALILDPTTSIGADLWYYVYIAHWHGLAPRTYSTGLVSRGIPVLSNVAPNDFSTGNSAVLNLPAPFNEFVVPVGEATCIGILRRNSANTGWKALQGAGDTYRIGGDGPVAVATTGTFPGTMTIAESQLPQGVRLVRLRYNMDIVCSGAGVDTSFQIQTRIHGGSIALSNIRIPLPGATTAPRWDLEVEVPYDPAGYDVVLSASNASLTAASGTFSAYVVGWTY